MYFLKTEKIVEFTWNHKPSIASAALNKKTGGTTCPEFKLHFKALVIKPV
jgi:hypothetical protein